MPRKRFKTPRQIEKSLAGTPYAIKAEEVDPLIRQVARKIRDYHNTLHDEDVTAEEVIAALVAHYRAPRSRARA
jgi:hypothetical protein